MTIDWQRFSERVPAGTHIKAGDALKKSEQALIRDLAGKEGILLRCGVEWTNPQKDAIIVQFFDNPLEGIFAPHELEYLIGGHWQSFEELMQGDISRPSP